MKERKHCFTAVVFLNSGWDQMVQVLKQSEIRKSLQVTKWWPLMDFINTYVLYIIVYHMDMYDPVSFIIVPFVLIFFANKSNKHNMNI